MARCGRAGFGRHGGERLGVVGCGTARLGPGWPGLVRQARHGLVRCGRVRRGQVRGGKAWFGLAGVVRRGKVRPGVARCAAA